MINEYLYNAGGQRLRTVESNTLGQALKRTFYPFANFEEEVRETPISVNILAEPGVAPEICLVKATATEWAYIGGSDNCVSGASMVYQLPAESELSAYTYYGFMITPGSGTTVVSGSASPTLYQQLPDFPQAGTTTLVWRTADWQDVAHTLNVSLVPSGSAPSFLNTPGLTFQVEKPIVAGPEATSTIQRSVYQFGGKAIAVREWNGGSSVLTYLHSDHLGSASILTDEAGDVVAGSSAKYYPFGGYRQRPATNPATTELGFTGHKHNDSVGLVYANARFYLPGIGRFASADTIVPELSQPQQLNRYAYSLNRPLSQLDPSGHVSCNFESGYCYAPTSQSSSHRPIVQFQVNGRDESWTAAERRVVYGGAMATGQALARQKNHNYLQTQQRYASMGEVYSFSPVTATNAFLAVYGGPVTFRKTGTACGGNGCYGEAVGERTINVYTDIYNANGVSQIPNDRTGARWAVHELFHAFETRVNNAVGITYYARNRLGADTSILRRPDNGDGTYGFAGPRYGWQQSPSGTTGEELADMGIGWVYGQWETGHTAGGEQGRARASFMDRYMPLWVNLATNQ